MHTLRTADDVEEYMFLLSLEPSENTLGILSREAEVELGEVHVAQSVSLVYQHSTGGCVWSTTPRFAAWIQQPHTPLSHLVRDKTVIELGCGTGALAMLLHNFVGERYIATDQKPLLKLCGRNCEGLAKVEIREFDWEKHEFEGIGSEGVIVACDTIYNEYLIGPFCDGIASVARSSPKVTSALVAVQLREPGVIESALKVMVDRFGEVNCYTISPGFVVFALDLS